MSLKSKIIIVLAAAIYGLQGCAFIPGPGPFNDVIDDEARVDITIKQDSFGNKARLDYALVNVNRVVIDQLNDPVEILPAPALESWPATTTPANIAISVGDTLSVTIYEAKSGGLFIPEQAGVRPGNFITLPSQTVDASGSITIPFIGSLKVVNATPPQVSRYIVDQLRDRAIDPQVIVTFSERRGSEVSVIGEVNNAVRFPLNFNGETVLDAIARAGGPRYPGYETKVTLQREGGEYTVAFDHLIQNPDANVYLRSNDILYLYQEPDVFTIFGAARFPGRHKFERRQLFLAEALGRAQGLDHFQADAAEVYVYRQLSKRSLRDLALAENANSRAMDRFQHLEQAVPTVFKFNLRKPDSFFLTQNFAIEPEDVIYIPDADTVDLQKFFGILSPTTDNAATIQSLE